MYVIAVIIRITEEIETKRKLCRKIPEGTKRITSMLDERAYIFIIQANIPLPSIVRECMLKAINLTYIHMIYYTQANCMTFHQTRVWVPQNEKTQTLISDLDQGI